MIKRVAVAASIVLSVGAGWCQAPSEKDTVPPVAPDFRRPAEAECVTTTSTPSTSPNPADTPAPALPVIPSTPGVMPPEVPPRPPLIVIPNEVKEMMRQPAPAAPHKPPLAWRARAHKLKQSTNAQQKILRTNYDAAIMSLIAALAQVNLRVDTLNSKAGELLAVPTDARSTQKFVFVFAEMPPGTVTVKGTPWTHSKTNNAMVESVLQRLDQPSSIKGGR